jgi:hypothetical protein
VLRQDDTNPLFTTLPDSDDKHLSTRAWKRSYTHPVTAAFEDAQFSYWRPNNIVSTRTLHKPSTGSYKVLLDAGGLYGLRWAGLVESAYGNGIVIQSQLNLVENVGIEPMAGHLLQRLVEYCQNATLAATAPLRILNGNNAPLQQVLDAASIATQKGLQGSGPILLDASYTPSTGSWLRFRIMCRMAVSCGCTASLRKPWVRLRLCCLSKPNWCHLIKKYRLARVALRMH